MNVLDDQVITGLVRDLADRAFAVSFVDCYRRMLDSRVGRIAAALESADLDSAMDAVLSLKTSSATVGARELARLARLLEHDVRRADLGGAQSTVALLPDAARRADLALASYVAVSLAS